MSYLDDIEHHGFAVFEDFVDSENIDFLLRGLPNFRIGKVESERGGKSFGIRDLLNVMPFTRALANKAAFRSLVEPILAKLGRFVLPP